MGDSCEGLGAVLEPLGVVLVPLEVLLGGSWGGLGASGGALGWLLGGLETMNDNMIKKKDFQTSQMSNPPPLCGGVGEAKIVPKWHPKRFQI